MKLHLRANHPDISKMVEDLDEADRKASEMKELNKDKQGRVLDKFLNMIAFTGMPLSMGDNPHFIEFYKEIDDKIRLPGRKGTTSLLVNVKFGAMYSKLKKLLDRVDSIHSTTDMWSNFKLRSSFIGFTGHVYDPVTKSRVRFRLALRPFNCPHTAPNIIEEATKIFREFGVMEKVSVFNFISLNLYLFFYL